MPAETNTAPSVDAIDTALATAAGTLGADEQQLAVAVLRLLAVGAPVSIGAAAAAARLPEPLAEQVLRSWPAVFWDDDVMTTFCHYVLHFTSPATAERWTAAHPGTFVISLGDAAELASRHATRGFGAWSA